MSRESRKISVPESYADITVKDLQKIRGLEGDEEFVAIKVIEILTGLNGRDVLSMRRTDRDEVLGLISDALNVETTKLIRRFTHDGIEYGFIPNLDEMTYGEFVDLETYQLDFKNIHKLLAVLYRPITKSYEQYYTIEDYEGSIKYSGVMEQIPSHIALGCLVFFYDLGKELLSNSLRFLEGELELSAKDRKTLQKNGVGTLQLRAYRETILQSLEKSQDFLLNPALPKLRTQLISMN
tara:strand:+ start:3545 stop:4258 length:714 start_codon:yes stop_codon:yes gene_type:complete